MTLVSLSPNSEKQRTFSWPFASVRTGCLDGWNCQRCWAFYQLLSFMYANDYPSNTLRSLMTSAIKYHITEYEVQL